jgi:aryl carrier-like protein
VLGHADIGVHDNFFDVGGDSLRLTAVLAALDGERLTAVDLFSHPTVAALAAHLDRAGDAGPSGPAGRAAHRGRDRRERINRHTNQQKEAGR